MCKARKKRERGRLRLVVDNTKVEEGNMSCDPREPDGTPVIMKESVMIPKGER